MKREMRETILSLLYTWYARMSYLSGIVSNLFCLPLKAIRDWADEVRTSEISYERAVAILVSKGYSQEVLFLSTSYQPVRSA